MDPLLTFPEIKHCKRRHAGRIFLLLACLFFFQIIKIPLFCCPVLQFQPCHSLEFFRIIRYQDKILRFCMSCN